LQMAGSYGETVKDWLDTTTRSAVLNAAGRELASHIEGCPGSTVDCFRAQHYLETELLKNTGTFVREGDERRFQPRR
jgi:hypothetical protein